MTSKNENHCSWNVLHSLKKFEAKVCSKQPNHGDTHYSATSVKSFSCDKDGKLVYMKRWYVHPDPSHETYGETHGVLLFIKEGERIRCTQP